MVSMLFNLAVSKIPTALRSSPDCITQGADADSKLRKYIIELEKEQNNVVEFIRLKLLGGELDIGK